MIPDDFKYKGLRSQLVQSLSNKGITDKRVLDAMMTVPRHQFFDIGLLDYAYVDKAYPIAAGQTISQPYTVAFQTQLLEVKPREKVLEIGTGSGYQAAILAQMGAKVFTIERQKELFKSSQRLFSQLGLTIRGFFGDGYAGKPTYGPFDKILVTCGAPFVPEALKEQLATGGYIVIPVDKGSVQTMQRVIKLSETEFKTEDFGLFSFVPMVSGTE
ncbi:MAG TPA: protein-L-isoaspartate(D-aspartate) O-methyltransferase [Salinivirgaceae bacterium]|nr:protein-L-isoaspartate(D-aspartate) O-methyltransferase [Salinivirgaceae bacterium]